MSYDIIYGKQFVKLRRTGEVIPILLAGSNNCYEIGTHGRNGRRTRSWDSMRYYNRKCKISEKPAVILKNLDAELNRIIRRHRGDKEAKPADIRNRFGYYASIVVGSGHCGGTSWSKYRSQFVNGINGALTIEELHNLGVNLYIYTSCYGDDCPGGEPATVLLGTERQYFEELKKWREWQGNNGRLFYLSFRPHDTDTVLRRLRQTRRREPKPKTQVQQDHCFVLSGDNGNLVKYTSRGFRYSFSNTGGKKFRTEDEAEKYRKRLITLGRYRADTWKVKRVNMPYTFMVVS